MTDKHVLGMTREEIIEHKEPCATAPNCTGAKCVCPFDCANYWLRAFGLNRENTVPRRGAAGARSLRKDRS